MTRPASLSNPSTELRALYDVVIVGSGYGGSVMAARLGQVNRKFDLGLSIALLERGREWQPGDFPERSEQLEANLRDASRAQQRNPQALFELRSRGDMNSLVASGLGGASLLDSGALTRPDPRIFALEGWPRALREDVELGRFEKFLRRAEASFSAAPLPAIMEPAGRRASADALTALGRRDRSLRGAAAQQRYALNFEDPSLPTCTGCGACMTGCNVGAKRSTTTNYLETAKHCGVEIFCGADLRRLRRTESGRFVLDLYHHDEGPVDWSLDPSLSSLRARLVVLAAGALGTSEILLRSRRAQSAHRRFGDTGAELETDLADHPMAFPRLIGQRVGANGNLLCLLNKLPQPIDSLGHAPSDTPSNYVCGPSSTRATVIGDALSPTTQLRVLNELSIPAALAPLVAQITSEHDQRSGIGPRLAAFGRRVLSLSTERNDPLNHVLPLLVTGHDAQQSQLELDENQLLFWRWPAGLRSLRAASTKLVKELALELGAELIDHPERGHSGGHAPLSLHPLGGCVMGDDASSGVVDDEGAMFDVRAGQETSERLGHLYVTGAAVIPSSLGVMPALTIVAIAERMAEKLSERLVNGELGLTASDT